MLLRRKDLKKEKILFQVSGKTKKKWESIQKMAEQEDLEIDQDELLMKSFLLLEKRLEKLKLIPGSPGDPGNQKRRTGDERTKGGSHQEEE